MKSARRSGVPGCPAVRQQRGQILGRVGGGAGEDVFGVGEELDAVTLAGGDQAEEGRGGAPAGVAKGSQVDLVREHIRWNSCDGSSVRL